MNHRVVEHPELLPGCDYLTQTASGPFVDTGLDIDDLANTGRVYLSFDTIYDLAQLLGCTPPEASKRGAAELERLAARCADLDRLVEGLRVANAALTAAGYSDPDAPLAPPAGDMDAVLMWVCEPNTFGEAQERAQAAYTSELLEPAPRDALLAELADIITPKKEKSSGKPVSE